MNLTELNAEQLEARKAELMGELSDAEKREDLTAEDLESLEGRKAEITAIDHELDARKKAAEEAEEIRRKVAEGNDTPIKTFEEERKMSYEVNTPEYRDIWLRNLQGKELNTEERAALTQAAAVIPAEMQNKIWEKLRENPLIAEVDLMHIPGYVTLPRENTTNDASWVAMSTASTDSADVVNSITLGAKKLIKTIEIEADIKAMSIPAFEDWLIGKLVEKMETAICAAIINGAGSATVPQGVMANAAGATAKTVAFTIAGLGEVMGALPSAYHRNAVWVMSAATFYGTILPLAADNNGILVMNGIEQRLLGHKVVLDENPAAKIIFGDFHNGYAFNFGSDIRVDSDGSVEFRKGSTVYRSMALADGAVVQGEAFVVATKTA
jgi:HK97 family phage major capsid protein